MSASLQTIPWSTGRMLFKCSACHSHLQTENDRKEDLKFCWHCGEKFGPEPKVGPTEGEWHYTRSASTFQGKVYSIDTLGRSELIAEVADVNTQRETDANGHLMAASKKLLAACKAAMRSGIPNITSGGMVSDAIAEAEKGKQ